MSITLHKQKRPRSVNSLSRSNKRNMLVLNISQPYSHVKLEPVMSEGLIHACGLFMVLVFPFVAEDAFKFIKGILGEMS